MMVCVSGQFLKSSILPHKEFSTNDCILQINNVSSFDTTLIIYTDVLFLEYFNLRNFSAVILNSKSNLKNYGLFNMYIFAINHTGEIINIFAKLNEYPSWNTRKRHFILVANKDIFAKELFEECWKYYIYNVIALSVLKNEIYTYFPYDKNASCGNNIIPFLLGKCKNTLLNALFPEKVINLEKCKIKLLALNRAPFVLNYSYSVENPNTQGYEVTLVNLIAKKLQITPVHVNNPHKDIGNIYLNRTKTYMLKDLFERKADVLYGGAFGNAKFVMDFDYTVCYSIHNMNWWVPTAEEMPKWKNLARLFNCWVWVAIFVTTLLQGILFNIISLFQHQVNHHQDYIIYFFTSLRILLQMSVATVPATRVFKFQFIIWFFTSLLIYTAYQSQLISVLTTPIFEKQISSVDDIFTSGIQYGFYDNIATVFNSNVSAVENKIVRNFVSCTLGVECVNRTAFKRDFALIKNSKQINYWMPRYWTTASGKKLLYGFEDYTYLALSWYWIFS